MKNYFILFVAALLIWSCDPDETLTDSKGNIAFYVTGSGPAAGRTFTLTPQKLVVSVEDAEGKTIFDNKILTLSFDGQKYASENIPLEQGQYKITRYLIVSGETAAYATPKSGSWKSGLIEHPLPLDFSVSSGANNTVTPSIVTISFDDSPEKFGYSDFGYLTPDAPTEEWMSVRVKLEMHVGGLFYENVDAPFKVTGYDQNNTKQWEEYFTYIGPESNDLKIKTGFHHYEIKVSKWGKIQTQTMILSDLWEGRVREGTVPLTRVFQTNVEPKRIKETVTSWNRVVNGNNVLVPSGKTTYEYIAGKIARTIYHRYDEQGDVFIPQIKNEFSYENGRVSKIVNTVEGNISSEDTYTYDAAGNATRIVNKSISPGVTTEANFTYNFSNRLIVAKYRHSNGNGFEYEFVNQHGNIKSDQTTRGGQICSQGVYTHDKNINPLKHLGYTDFLLRNSSLSNRMSEDIRYVGCSFPSLIPESYEYTYDSDEYPVKQTTYYKSSTSKMVVEYAYY